MSTELAKRKLPTIQELHHAPEEAFKNDQFNMLLNQEPNAKWIRKHPIIKVKNEEGKNTAYQYMPVEKHEYLLTRIFGIWRREIKNVQQILNSVVTTVRVHYIHPVTGEWSYHDGVGACPIQTDKGADALDTAAVKSAGVQMAAPASASYAFKDACECLGKLFGKDLNRRDVSIYKMSFSDPHENEQQQPKQEQQEPKQQTNSEVVDENDYQL